jgi:hypothetical protein
MNFDEAVIAHSEWKRKLHAYLEKPDHSLNATDVAANNKCNLGKWLAGEGLKFASLPGFPKLVDEHTRFHKAAADVIRKADSGQNVTSDVALGAQSEFGRASGAVVLALMDLKKSFQH